MGIREDVLALAEDVEATVGGCVRCIADKSGGGCLSDDSLECSDAICREVAKRLRAIVERDAEDVTTVSAYDLLSEEDREAIEWVRKHGGLGAVRRRWEFLSYYDDPVPRSYMEKRLARLKRQIDENHAALRRKNQRIAVLASEINREHNENRMEFLRRAGNFTAFADDVCERLAPQLRHVEGCTKDVMDAALEALDRRLMPEGMEWPTVDGEPVVIGERMRSCGIEDCKVVGIDPANARLFLAFNDIEKEKAVYFPDLAKDCHRPAPKVLDADGVEIRVGDVLYRKSDGRMVEVAEVYEKTFIDADDYVRPGDGFTHQRPVLDADGVEVHKGDEVWSTTGEFDGKRTVSSVHIDPDEPPYATFEERQKPYSCLCCYLTHRAPVLAADGEPLEVGQTVWHVGNGVEFTVIGLPRSGEYQAVKLRLDDGAVTGLDPDQLTHQRPVLDEDGVPIKVGDTVWSIDGDGPLTVESVSPDDDKDKPEDIVWCGEWLYDKLANQTIAAKHRIADQLTHTKPEPPDSRQAVVNEIGDEMAARIDLLVSSGRWSDAD